METNKWDLLSRQAEAMTEGVHPLSALCNILSLVWCSADSVNWAGLYLCGPDSLYLGPFMGEPACMQIPYGQGVVGTCANQRKPLLVPDVHAFAGHIACDARSRSETVFPLVAADGRLLGVLDIDCLEPDGISRPMQQAFGRIASLLIPLLEALIGQP